MTKTIKVRKSPYKHKKILSKLLLLETIILIIALLGILYKNGFLANASSKYGSPQNSVSTPKKEYTGNNPHKGLPVTGGRVAPSVPLPSPSGRLVKIPILMYHYIGNNPNPKDKVRDVLSTSPDKFDAQMGYLSTFGFTPITLDTLYSGLKGITPLPPKPIVLTFDDGYVDFYLNAYPILKKYNFRGVSFIPTGLMNQGYYLSWAQIKDMQSSGLISFEAHTVNHLDLISLSAAKIKYQIFQSKKDLEEQLGTPVNFFAYPYGTSNQAIWQKVKEAGFIGAVGTWYGTIETEGTQYDWPRVRITGGMSLDDFKKRI